jgi:murein DD-endopeptidase MepM/ murein hydrolase activator NlpD
MTPISKQDERQATVQLRSWLLPALIVLLLIAGCTASSQSCSSSPYEISTTFDTSNTNPDLVFRFPLDGFDLEASPEYAGFTARGGSRPEDWMYHAAEDYHLPAGEPVYAIADGEVAFSGRMGGYGWLVIVDHPQFNLYSLYGHLSPSRWQIDRGEVIRGELLGYLGDPDENGGSAENPLQPHLHFGIRAGQRADYPGHGAWRWMAGWIRPCPADIGWLQPSEILSMESPPAGEYQTARGNFLGVWTPDLVLLLPYLIGGPAVLLSSWRRNQPWFLAAAVGVILLAGFIFLNKMPLVSPAIMGLGLIMAVIGIYRFIWIPGRRPTSE